MIKTVLNNLSSTDANKYCNSPIDLFNPVKVCNQTWTAKTKSHYFSTIKNHTERLEMLNPGHKTLILTMMCAGNTRKRFQKEAGKDLGIKKDIEKYLFYK